MAESPTFFLNNLPGDHGSALNLDEERVKIIEAERVKINLWPNNRGIQYELGTDTKGVKEIITFGSSNNDGNIEQIFRVDKVSPQGSVIARREPEIDEMTSFLRVADEFFAHGLYPAMLRKEIKARIENDAKAFLRIAYREGNPELMRDFMRMAHNYFSMADKL